MKKFLLRILLLPLPVLALLLALPLDKEWQFGHYGDSCMQREAWIYDQIYHNAQPIDLLFLGSSHTINAVDDAFLQENLAQKWRVQNFGYCFFGRDLQLLLLEGVLEKKKPKALVVEVRQRENRGGHRVFPYLASTPGIFLANPMGSGRYFQNLKEHLNYKLKYINSQIGIQMASEPYEMEESGFFTLPDTAKSEILTKAKEKRTKKAQKESSNRPLFQSNFPFDQLKKMASRCQENQIELYLLYLPSYGQPQSQPNELDRYRELGRVLLPPKSLLDKPENWYDEGHFNTSGANALSKYLLEVFKE